MPVNLNPANLTIESHIRDYEVRFESSTQFLSELSVRPQTCFIIDENVARIYADTLLACLPERDTIIVPVSEERKSFDTVHRLYDRLVEMPAKRNLTVVSIGGGILQDVSGFAASTLYRGVNWIFVPTTLLAQADSCIGSKTSLNYGNYKNLLGTFFPPNRVHIYPPFLKSQSDADFYSGYGEVIKLHLMGGPQRLRLLLSGAPRFLSRDSAALLKGIQESLSVKLAYMAGDEFDTGRRNLLNFGHDFGHALESASNFAVPHGQAVVIGMIAANQVAASRGILDAKLANEIAEEVLLPGLVVRPAAEALQPDPIIAAMRRDKKRTGENLALIMMNSLFDFVRVNDLTTNEVELTLNGLTTRLGETLR